MPKDADFIRNIVSIWDPESFMAKKRTQTASEDVPPPLPLKLKLPLKHKVRGGKKA